MRFWIICIILLFHLQSQIQGQQWTWMGGPQTVGNVGNYGVKGVPDANNLPPARESAMFATDSKGSVYLFGGATSIGMQNDLWKWDGEVWTWVSGSKVHNDMGNYTDYRNGSTAAVPAARWKGHMWIDSQDLLWLFGGQLNAGNVLNDFWMWNGSVWTWVDGGQSQNQMGNTFYPGVRVGGHNWRDSNGTVWFFGGQGYMIGCSPGNFLNDLWKWDHGVWTLVSNHSSFCDAGNYTSDRYARPRSRASGVTWQNGTDLWLFGGFNVNLRSLNDLWKYDTLTNSWIWVAGSSQVDDDGVINGLITIPSARRSSAVWVDNMNNLWLFGGVYNGFANPVYIIDLWKFDGLRWIWVAGTNSTNGRGFYGEKQLPDGRNFPGCRGYAASWQYNDSLWLIGGVGFDANKNLGRMNNIWKFDPYVVDMPSSTDFQVDNSTNPPLESSLTEPDPPFEPSPTSSPDRQTTIIAIVVPVIVVLLCIVAIISTIVLRRKRFRRTTEESESSSFRLSSVSPKKLKNITILERLGGGNFGDVFHGKWQETTDVALKKLKTSQQKEEFEKEALMLGALSHKNIVQYFGLYNNSEGESFIVTEYMPKGSLDRVLRTQGDGITQGNLLYMARDTAAGMQYLGDQGIIHRDLALRNLLVVQEGSNYLIKIADFGMSRTVLNEDYYKSDSALFPVKWSAPEVIQYSKFSTKSDVWSFGIVLWEIFSRGMVPYPGMSNSEAAKGVISGYRMEAPQECPEGIYQLMLACWNSDPERRPSFLEIYNRIEDVWKDYDSKMNWNAQQQTPELEPSLPSPTIYLTSSNQYANV